MKPWAAFAGDRIAIAAAGILLAAAVLFVGSSLRKPDVSTYVPTPIASAEVGPAVVGPRLVTVDASKGDEWRFFDFSRGSVVEAPGPTEWDIAFNRFRVIANGGAGFVGEAGVLSLGDVPFDSVRAVPEAGYVVSRSPKDSVNAAIERWYDYSWTSHLLTPKRTTYAIRTADRRYAKLEMIGYYCEGAVAGCVTFRYVYQGGGETDVATQ